jgi:hypothetical protein
LKKGISKIFIIYKTDFIIIVSDIILITIGGIMKNKKLNIIDEIITLKKSDLLIYISLITSSKVMDILQSSYNSCDFDYISKYVDGTRLAFGTKVTLDLLLANNIERKSNYYQEIKKMYTEIIENTKDLYNELGIIDPTHIFSVYSYMLKRGYFSTNMDFAYGFTSKDLSRLLGADIIAGRGVCRNISSFLVDLYNSMGILSLPLSVNVSRKTLNQIEEISEMTMKVDNQKDKLKILSKILTFLKFSNHMITLAEKNDKTYIFDPTNDCACTGTNVKQISLIGNDKARMLVSYLYPMIYEKPSAVIKTVKLINNNTIDNETFKKLYKEGFEIFMTNEKRFEQFYDKNAKNYSQISEKMNQIPTLIKRRFPILK